MKYWFGYLTAAIFTAIAWVLQQFAQRYSELVDMVYPYVIRNLQNILATWTAPVDFPLWQLLAVALGALVLCSFVLIVALKKNWIQWLGWVAAVFAAIYMLHTGLWGLNYYAGPLAQDMRLEVATYTLDELVEATEFYRDQANALASQVSRNPNGQVDFQDFDALAKDAYLGFDALTYTHHYPIFAGSKVPVKKLGWADMYSSMGITGVTFGLTGEACVNPQIPDVTLPFTICHEMAHRMCIAPERDANFAGFLACSVHPNPEYQYSGYFMAFRYCYNALNSLGISASAAASARITEGISDQLRRDMNDYSSFFAAKKNDSATKFADTVNDTYLKSSGDASGIASYGEVCDLLVNWHIQTIVLPSITEDVSRFDPYDENQIDLSGIVNAR